MVHMADDKEVSILDKDIKGHQSDWDRLAELGLVKKRERSDDDWIEDRAEKKDQKNSTSDQNND